MLDLDQPFEEHRAAMTSSGERFSASQRSHIYGWRRTGSRWRWVEKSTILTQLSKLSDSAFDNYENVNFPIKIDENGPQQITCICQLRVQWVQGLVALVNHRAAGVLLLCLCGVLLSRWPGFKLFLKSDWSAYPKRCLVTFYNNNNT